MMPENVIDSVLTTSLQRMELLPWKNVLSLLLSIATAPAKSCVDSHHLWFPCLQSLPTISLPCPYTSHGSKQCLFNVGIRPGYSFKEFEWLFLSIRIQPPVFTRTSWISGPPLCELVPSARSLYQPFFPSGPSHTSVLNSTQSPSLIYQRTQTVEMITSDDCPILSPALSMWKEAVLPLGPLLPFPSSGAELFIFASEFWVRSWWARF